MSHCTCLELASQHLLHYTACSFDVRWVWGTDRASHSRPLCRRTFANLTRTDRTTELPPSDDIRDVLGLIGFAEERKLSSVVCWLRAVVVFHYRCNGVAEKFDRFRRILG